MMGFGTLGEYALGQVTGFPSWYERDEDSESWTEVIPQAETWTEVTPQSETWAEV